MQKFDVKNPYSDNTVIEENKLHGSRRVIANHLLNSYQNKAHATMHRYLEVEKLRAFASEIKKGSIVDHFIRAVALTLKEMPKLNATFDGETYRIFKDVNICYAINTERGLVTPVLRNADNLALEEFYDNRKHMSALVMEWKQEMKDIMGGTFTISNLGNFGVDFLHPIINPPQVAILGMGRLCKQSIAWDLSELPTLKELMPMSLTFDHSVIDGSLAAEFVQLLQDKINNPKQLWDIK
jgi:pyruvate/2-oxoglutarate dehydrogenase complex dihydrolipoamide acyltransferase (E2) component